MGQQADFTWRLFESFFWILVLICLVFLFVVGMRKCNADKEFEIRCEERGGQVVAIVTDPDGVFSKRKMICAAKGSIKPVEIR